MKQDGRKIHLAREVMLPWAVRPACQPVRRAMPTAPVYPMERVARRVAEAAHVPATDIPVTPVRRPCRQSVFRLVAGRFRGDPFVLRLSRLE